MKKERIIGTVLLVLAGVVISAMLLHVDLYWRVVDFTMVFICIISGVLLLSNKK